MAVAYFREWHLRYVLGWSCDVCVCVDVHVRGCVLLIQGMFRQYVRTISTITISGKKKTTMEMSWGIKMN